MALINVEIARNALGLEKPANTLVKAIVRGVGSALYPWSRGRTTKADVAALAEWRKALQELEDQSAELDLSLSERTKLRLIHDGERFQANREAIAVESVRAFKALPPNNEINDLEDIDEEWLNLFWRYAESVGSGDLQSLWGKVLARQASGTSPVSKRTLSFLSTLSREEASWIEALAQVTIGCVEGSKAAFAVISSMSYLGNTGSLATREGSLEARQLEPQLAQLTCTGRWGDLDSIGVLSQTGWAYEAMLPISSKGAHLTVAGRPYVITDGSVKVAINVAGGYFQLGSGMRLSRLGEELLGIVHVEPNGAYLSTLSEIVRGFGMELEPAS